MDAKANAFYDFARPPSRVKQLFSLKLEVRICANRVLRLSVKRVDGLRCWKSVSRAPDCCGQMLYIQQESVKRRLYMNLEQKNTQSELGYSGLCA